jgi:uncharacterized protein (DUF488 family)
VRRVSDHFFTIGHSTRSFDDFVALIRAADIDLVVDIRAIPRSRTNPQFNKDTLSAALMELNISYEHIATLGGLRGRTKDLSRDVNGFWSNESFHNYADYALSSAFQAGLSHLRKVGHRRCCTIMCSEAVWWRCHRRIITDYLIANGETVFHIMGKGRLENASLTKAAVIQPGKIVHLHYPAAGPSQ